MTTAPQSFQFVDSSGASIIGQTLPIGAQAAATSVATAPSFSGVGVLGYVGALNFGPVPFTLTLGAGAYPVGACLGGLKTVSVFRNLAQASASIVQLAFQWPTGLTNPVTILAFSRQPTSTTFTDGSTITLAATDAEYLITGAPLTITPATTPGMTAPTFAVATGEWPAKNADATTALNIYIAVLMGSVAIGSGAPTVAYGSVSGVLD